MLLSSPTSNTSFARSFIYPLMPPLYFKVSFFFFFCFFICRLYADRRLLSFLPFRRPCEFFFFFAIYVNHVIVSSSFVLARPKIISNCSRWSTIAAEINFFKFFIESAANKFEVINLARPPIFDFEC